MKFILAENEKYVVYKASHSKMIAVNKPGVPKFYGKFQLSWGAECWVARRLLEFLCPDKTTDASAPDA